MPALRGEEIIDFQVIGQLVKAGRINARAQPEWPSPYSELRRINVISHALTITMSVSLGSVT
jgi:hypothetical protein